MAKVLPACLLLALLLLAPALLAQEERGLIMNLVRGDQPCAWQEGPTAARVTHGGLEVSVGFSGVVRELGAWEISSVKGWGTQKVDQTSSQLLEPARTPTLDGSKGLGMENAFPVLSQPSCESTKHHFEVGGILGQTEEMLQRGSWGMGTVLSISQRQSWCSACPQTRGLTARVRLKGDKEGLGAQALPCAAGHRGAVPAECPVQERLLPP